MRYAAKNPYSYVHANVVGHVTLLEAIVAQRPLPRLVYASSSSVYGLNTKQPFAEGDRVDNPASLYASTKRVRPPWGAVSGRRLARSAPEVPPFPAVLERAACQLCLAAARLDLRDPTAALDDPLLTTAMHVAAHADGACTAMMATQRCPLLALAEGLKAQHLESGEAQVPGLGSVLCRAGDCASVCCRRTS